MAIARQVVDLDYVNMTILPDCLSFPSWIRPNRSRQDVQDGPRRWPATLAPTLLWRTGMQTRGRASGLQQVAIVSTNPETLDGLQSYLRGAGVAARVTRRLEDCAGLTARSTALVLFPDDFPLESVVATVTELGSVRPAVLRVLVTSRPKTFEPLVSDRENVIVVPRPVWGWKILDAIRAHADRVGTKGGAS